MKVKKFVGKFSLVLISPCLLTLFTYVVYGAIPQTINYQGYLIDVSGVPVNQTVQITFGIYNVPSGGSALWTETQSVTVTQGVYNVELGGVTPIGLAFDIPYYLGVKVGADSEMTPRIVLTSVGYAFRAKTVESVGSHTHSGADITIGTVSEARIDSTIARDSEVTAAVNAHALRTDNPHSTTASQVGAVGLNQINSITSGMIVDGTITNADISGTAAIDFSKLSGVASSTHNHDAAYVNMTGDFMTGTLNLPANGLVVGGNQLVLTGDKVGIGTGTPNEQLEITGNLRLPVTTASVGIIKLGDNRFIYSYGTGNFFAGFNAGNLTLTGWYNTASGSGALYSNTTGYRNTASGYEALFSNTTGNGNTASGSDALYSNKTGNSNTALGYNAGVTATPANANTTGSYNTFIGALSGPGTTQELTNATAIGYKALVSSNNSLVLGGVGTEAVNVGIGTTTPKWPLHIANLGVAMNSNSAIAGNLYYDTAWRYIGNGYGNIIKFESGNGGIEFYTAPNNTSGPGAIASSLNIGMYVANNGAVGIGTTAPGWLLHVNGEAAKPGGGSWTDSSDIRLKKNVKRIENALEKVLGLRGVEFEWDEAERKSLLPGVQMGMIAQEVEEVFPQWVGTDKKGYKELTFRGFEAVTVEAMRELKSENQKLRATIENLTKKMEEFEQRYSKADDMTTLAMRNLLISNGILTQDGELNIEMVEKLGWKFKGTELAKRK